MVGLSNLPVTRRHACHVRRYMGAQVPVAPHYDEWMLEADRFGPRAGCSPLAEPMLRRGVGWIGPIGRSLALAACRGGWAIGPHLHLASGGRPQWCSQILKFVFEEE